MSGLQDDDQLKSHHYEWIEQAVMGGRNKRHPAWSEAVAVGSAGFVSQMKQEMGYSAMGREVEQTVDAHMLREPESAYSVHFDA